MLEDLELFLSDKIVTIIISFVTEQSFCIARMVFRRLRNSSYSSFNCSKSTKTRFRYVSLATILRSQTQLTVVSAF